MRNALHFASLVGGAFLAVFVTTAGDAVMLVPFLSQQRFSISARFLHGACFVATLQAFVWASWAVALGLDQAAAQQVRLIAC